MWCGSGGVTHQLSFTSPILSQERHSDSRISSDLMRRLASAVT